ncbi:hypothetical protein PAHAL_1G158600 [Panicum hallii]|jgi:hypothetical protein|uniref:Uncharacterized protein n=1 Tax=Panicum hallii TaxID=206008 RepID=A0A2T8KVH2_9POAL|nr:hypothetical protein PAHAL_1G158600 [Panicum hallii]
MFCATGFPIAMLGKVSMFCATGFPIAMLGFLYVLPSSAGGHVTRLATSEEGIFLKGVFEGGKQL